MSFRFNLSQNLNESSFIKQGNQLFASSIGITGNGTALSCRLNVDQQDYTYCKTKEQKIWALLLVEKKLQKWAFREIQKYTHYHKQFYGSIFLPDALERGNYGALTKFLGNLRSNRVNSYIKLNLQESRGHFHKAMTILKPLTKIAKKRVTYCFYKMRDHMNQMRKREKERILFDIQRISSIQNHNSEQSEPMISPKAKIINVTYVPIHINPQKWNQLSLRKQSMTIRDFSSSKKSSNSKNSVSTYVDINDLIDESKIKQYQFKHITTLRMGDERGRFTYSRQR